jgi:hypothetical protein
MPRQYTRLFVTPAVFLASWLAFVVTAWTLDRGAVGVSLREAVMYALPAALVHGSVVLLYHNRWWYTATRRIFTGSLAAGLATSLVLLTLFEQLQASPRGPFASFAIVVVGLCATTIVMTLLSVVAVGAHKR